MIYEKLNKARSMILASAITKDAKGFNFKYIDLPQIEPEVIKACSEVGLTPWVSFTESHAQLDLYDAEDGTCLHTEVMMSSDMCKAGQSPIQSVGAMMTYARRYLYMTTFGISEHDSVDDIETSQKIQRAEHDIEREELINKITSLKADAIQMLIDAAKADTVDDIPTETLKKALERLERSKK